MIGNVEGDGIGRGTRGRCMKPLSSLIGFGNLGRSTNSTSESLSDHDDEDEKEAPETFSSVSTIAGREVDAADVEGVGRLGVGIGNEVVKSRGQYAH